MRHWLDELALATAERRISRRRVILTGVRALAGAALVGAGLWLVSPVGSALGVTPCGEVSDQCVAEGDAAQQAADAACAAETQVNQPACYAQAATVGAATRTQCALAEGQTTCGPCGVCRNGGCATLCGLDCQACDPTAPGGCRDTCPADQYCDQFGPAEQNGTCSPRCPTGCLRYDASLSGCVDTCTQQNPCMACLQGRCESHCPHKSDFCDIDGVCKPCDFQNCRHIDPQGYCRACNPACEVCKNGACGSTCPAGELCCGGECQPCACGGTCVNGVCQGAGVDCGNDVCCPAGTQCSPDAPPNVFMCCPESASCCPLYFARCC